MCLLINLHSTAAQRIRNPNLPSVEHATKHLHRFRHLQNGFSFLFQYLPQPKSQALRQNHTVLRRAALSGPERAPDIARRGIFRALISWSTNKFYTLEKSLTFKEHESSDLHLSEYAPFGLNESNKCSPFLAQDNIQVGDSDGVQL